MRRTLHAILVATPLMLTAIGCGTDTIIPSTATLNGTWIRPNEVPGSHESWTLAVTGKTIAGTGDWSGEACCGGTIAITGTIANDGVHLDLTVVTTVGNPRPAFHEHFDGTLTSESVLEGLLTPDGVTAAEVRMQRQ
jgi:hypothetical protein